MKVIIIRNSDKIRLVMIPCGTAEVFSLVDNWQLEGVPTFIESYRTQGVPVVVRRELCKNVRLGSKVTVIGVPTHKLSTHSHRTTIDLTMEVHT